MSADVTVNVGVNIDAEADDYYATARRMGEALNQLKRSSERAAEASARSAEGARRALERWNRGLAQLRAGYSRFFEFASRGFQTLVTWIGRVTLAAGGMAAGLLGWGVGLNGQLDMATRKLANFVGGMQGAKRIIEEVRQFSASTPFEFTGLAEGAGFLGAMRTFGQGGVTSWTKRAAALAAAKGEFSDAAIQEAARAIGYLQAGRRGEAVESLTRFGISPDTWTRHGARYRQTGSGMTWESSPAEMMDALARAIDQEFLPMLAEMSRTLPGLLSTLRDKIKEGLTDLAAPLYDVLVPLVERFNKHIEAFSKSPAFGRFVGWMGDLAGRFSEWAQGAMPRVFDWLARLDPAAIGQTIQDIFGPIIEAFRELRDSIDPKAIGEALRALVEFLGAITSFVAKHPNAVKVAGASWLANAAGLPQLALGGYNAARGAWNMGQALRSGATLAPLAGMGGGALPTAAGGGGLAGTGTTGGGLLSALAAYRGANGARGLWMNSQLGRRMGHHVTRLHWRPIVEGVDRAEDYFRWTQIAPRLRPQVTGWTAEAAQASKLARAGSWLGRFGSKFLGPVALAAGLAEGGVWGADKAGHWYGGTHTYAMMQERAPWANTMLKWTPGMWLTMQHAENQYRENEAAKPVEGFQERWTKARGKYLAEQEAEKATQERMAREYREFKAMDRARSMSIHAQEAGLYYAGDQSAQRHVLSFDPGGGGSYGKREIVLNQVYYINAPEEVADIVREQVQEVWQQ